MATDEKEKVEAANWLLWMAATRGRGRIWRSDWEDKVRELRISNTLAIALNPFYQK